MGENTGGEGEPGERSGRMNRIEEEGMELKWKKGHEDGGEGGGKMDMGMEKKGRKQMGRGVDKGRREKLDNG